jgi:hypothetical protein
MRIQLDSRNDARMPPSRVVEVLEVVTDHEPRAVAVLEAFVVESSARRVAKKLAEAALSQPSLRPLLLAAMPWPRSALRWASLA